VNVITRGDNAGTLQSRFDFTQQAIIQSRPGKTAGIGYCHCGGQRSRCCDALLRRYRIDGYGRRSFLTLSQPQQANLVCIEINQHARLAAYLFHAQTGNQYQSI